MTVARLQPFAVTIFAEMSALAAQLGAVNLGQGFPDEDGPPEMLRVAQNALAEGVNQYPPGLGIAPLRGAIAAAVIGLVEPSSDVLVIDAARSRWCRTAAVSRSTSTGCAPR